MRRWLTFPAALLLLVLVIAGCGGGSSSSSSESEPAETGGTTQEESGGSKEVAAEEGEGGAGGGSMSGTVSYISPVGAQPSQAILFNGFAKAAKEVGWSSNVLDSALSPEKQVSAIETAVNQGNTAITSWTLDPNAAAGAYETAQNKKIPVVGVNSEGPGLSGTVWWEIEQCESGGPQQVSAEAMNEMHPGAKIILIGFEGAESTRRYQECFAKEAKKAGLDIINETNNEADNAAGSQKVFEPLLTKYPEVEAVWCYNDESALGVSAALLAAGKEIATTENPEGVIVTGQNGDPGAIEAVEQGRMTWTWDPDNFATGFAAVQMMEEAVEGENAKELVVISQKFSLENLSEYVEPEKRSYTLQNYPIKK
jgi:ribose transport system substrate-binding protein